MTASEAWMTAYLRSAEPRSAEEIVDEMLAIMSDTDRWRQKKKAEEANAKSRLTNCSTIFLLKY